MLGFLKHQNCILVNKFVCYNNMLHLIEIELYRYCRQKGDAASDQNARYTWFFLRANFLPSFRSEVLNLLGMEHSMNLNQLTVPYLSILEQKIPLFNLYLNRIQTRWNTFKVQKPSHPEWRWSSTRISWFKSSKKTFSITNTIPQHTMAETFLCSCLIFRGIYLSSEVDLHCN